MRKRISFQSIKNGGANNIRLNKPFSKLITLKLSTLKFIMILFITSTIMVSCGKENESNILVQKNEVSNFTPQCNENINLDTTIHVKIALMTLKMMNDRNFSQKTDSLLQESNPTEQKYYDILGFQGLELTSGEIDYLQELEKDVTAKENFYRDVERQYNCLVNNLVQVRVGFWETLWGVGSSAVAAGVGCTLGGPAGCVAGFIYAANTLGGLACKYHPEKC